MPENNEIKNIKVIKGAPFLKAKDTVPRIMWDVSLALLPAILASVYFFGLSAAFVILNAIISCVIFDFICLKARNNKKINYGSSFDGSAVVTGILLSFNLPSTVPWWLVTISSAVAIIITKHFFGGLGRNIFNPALAGRIFAMHAWPDFMSASWIPPRTVWNSAGINLPWTSIDNSAVLKAFNTYATPLHDMKEGLASKLPSLTNMFLGNIGGCLGETSAAALLLGAIYLLIRKRITLIIPLTYIGTVGLLTWVFAGDQFFTGAFMYHILGGGLILGACFMATDMITSPYTPKGQLIFAASAGVLTTLIRLKGGFPEGVSYSIFFMNALVPLIDRYTKRRIYGCFKRKKNV